MKIQIKRATLDGIKTCTGELFECGEYQFCIAWVEDTLQAIELSTGFSAARNIVSYSIGAGESEDEYIMGVKSMVQKRLPYMEKALKKAIEISDRLFISYPLNERIERQEGDINESN